MKVVVRELGSRPPIATPARLNAPQGAKALADLLAPETFADLCIINIDWEGDGFTPVMEVITIKWFIEYNGQRLEHRWPIELEDAFGIDNMDNSILRSMVSQLREHFDQQTEARKTLEAQGRWSNERRVIEV